MSATEQTPFLKLPLITATDKPTWLGDFDSAMTKIDTGVAGVNNEVAKLPSQIATAIDTANAAQTVADAAQKAAAEAASAASAASAAAANALQVANSAQEDVNYFNLVTIGDLGEAAVTVPSTITLADSRVYYALNAEGTYGKFYGQTIVRNINGTSGNKITIKGVPFKAPANDFTVQFVGFSVVYDTNTAVQRVQPLGFEIHADGSIVVGIPPTANKNGYVNLEFLAIPIYFKDFGDVDPNAMLYDVMGL